MPTEPTARVRIGLAPRSQPFDESMDSLDLAIMYAQAKGIQIVLEKVRRGCPGFQNAGPMMAHMLAAGDTHLFIAADDILYPPDVIVRMVNADKDVVNGVYRKNTIYQLTPANYTETWDEFAEKFKAGGLYETKFACGHTMTIKRHVIEKMMADYPELAYKVGDETQYALFLPMILDGQCFQDDWSFSIRARQSGFTLWDDYGCKLKHYCYDFLGFEGLEAANAGSQ
jgi:hypothetical protein